MLVIRGAPVRLTAKRWPTVLLSKLDTINHVDTIDHVGHVGFAVQDNSGVRLPLCCGAAVRFLLKAGIYPEVSDPDRPLNTPGG